MDDRQLLELAAKAAGIERSIGGDLWSNARGQLWNPLADDGDALRLAVKLQMEITIWNKVANARARGYAEWAQESGEDGASATRRAIVRAAASIGAKEGE